MIRKTYMALAGSLALVSSAFGADTYPRIATISTGGAQAYWDASYQRKIATADLAILSVYPGWGSGRSTTMNTAVQQIKAINPNTKVFLYTLAESLLMPADPPWVPLAQQLDREKWWLYTSGFGGGSIVPSSYGNGRYSINISSQSRKNSSGQNFAQWYGTWLAAQFGKPNPSIDGLFLDNVYWAPRKDGDWNGDGKMDSQKNPTVQAWLRQGHIQELNAMKAAMPGKLFIANAADWGLQEAVITEFVGKFNGGVFEAMLGKSFSIETWAGWDAMMKAYRKIMGALAAPKYGVCVQSGSVTDYQAMRYGLATCSLDDGYFAFSNQSDSYHDIPQFDEYKANLGTASSSPPTSAWQSGVYRRDFSNGIVLVNPKGNGARTVNLGGEFVKLKGTQAPSVNDGSTVTSVTLKDRDGIILMRKGTARSPESPASFRVQ